MAKPIIKRITVANIESSLERELENFIEAQGGTVFHEIRFNKIASEAFGSELSYFVARKNCELVGCCPCHSYKDKLIIRSLSNLSSNEIPYGGWVFDSTKITISELLLLTRLRLNEALQISSNIELKPGQQSDVGNIRKTILNTILIKLAGHSEDDLFDAFVRKQRNKIRRAEKLGVEIRQITPDDFGIFRELSSELKQRTGLITREESFFKEVFSQYHALGRSACFTAFYDGESISSMIVLANKNFTIAWVAGRKSDLPNNLYQNELLFWESIRWASNYGSDYYDLCGLDEVKFPQLARIKLSFSKDVQNFYSYDIKSIWFRLINKVQRLALGKR